MSLNKQALPITKDVSHLKERLKERSTVRNPEAVATSLRDLLGKLPGKFPRQPVYIPFADGFLVLKPVGDKYHTIATFLTKNMAPEGIPITSGSVRLGPHQHKRLRAALTRFSST